MRTMARAAAGLGAALALSCSVPESNAPERIANDWCDDVFRCDCNPPPYTSEAECQAMMEQNVLDVQVEAAMYGLDYDGECTLRWANLSDRLGCDTYASVFQLLDVLCDTIACPMYHGDARAGEACRGFIGEGLSDCRPGYTCSNGVCIEFDCNLGPGDVCFNGNDFTGLCRRGLACDPFTGACVDAPGVGDPCPGGVCDPERAYCDFTTFTCFELPTLGESCAASNGQCADADCQMDVCVEGEPLICGF